MINWLTLFKEIIDVYSENHTKRIHKMNYLLLKQVGHIVTIGLLKVKFISYSS
jgi:hypothetical protein